MGDLTSLVSPKYRLVSALNGREPPAAVAIPFLIGTVLGVGVLASYVPARRASSIDLVTIVEREWRNNGSGVAGVLPRHE